MIKKFKLHAFSLFLVSSFSISSLFPGTACAEAIEGLLAPEWLTKKRLTTNNGYADLAWQIPEDGVAEFYRLKETVEGNEFVHFIDRSALTVYRIDAGEYAFSVAACVKTADGVVDQCGEESTTSKLIVRDAVKQGLANPGTQSTHPVAAPGPVAASTGPEQLRPGLWNDSDKSGMGWSFYWANRLMLPESDPLFGNAYDLVGHWYTYEAKELFIDDCTPNPCEFPMQYRPVVLTLKAVEFNSSSYSGGVYVTRNGVESNVGSATVTFGSGNTDATVTWANVTFKLETLSGTDNLSLLAGGDPTSTTNVSHLAGVWKHSTDDSYTIVHDLGSVSEALNVIFEDSAGDPVWVQGTHSGSPVSSGTDFCVGYITDGYSPAATTPGNWSPVWHESGCDMGDTVSATNRNSRRRFVGDDSEKLWINFTLPGTQYSTGSIVIGSSSSLVDHEKRANFHDISYVFSAGGSSCGLTHAVPSCTVELNWFTDGDFPGASAFEHKSGGGRTLVQTSTAPAMLDVTHTITSAGDYDFELRMGDSTSDTEIATTSSFTVIENRQPVAPPAPLALHGIWKTTFGKFDLYWSHPDTQTVLEYRIKEWAPGASNPTTHVVAPGTTRSKNFDKSSSPTGFYRYSVQACNSYGCSPETEPLNWPVSINSSSIVFQDDFEADAGWVENAEGTDTASRGLWERDDPQWTSLNGYTVQRNNPTSGVNDLVTGRLAGSVAGSHDVDGGVTSIVSPAISLPSQTGQIMLSFQFYFNHWSGSEATDYFRTYIKGSAGDVLVTEELASPDIDTVNFQKAEVDLTEFAGDTIQIRFEAADTSNSLIEAAVDDVLIEHYANNTPPTVTSPGNQSNENGDSVSLQINATDPDPDTLSYSVTGLPGGLNINSSSGLISGTVSASDGNYSVTVTVNDGAGGVDSTSFTWTISSNTPPTITNPGSQTSAPSDSVTLDITVSDADGDNLSCSDGGTLPGSLSVAISGGSSACRVSGTVTASEGNYPVLITVDDGNGGSDTTSFNWEVVSAGSGPETPPAPAGSPGLTPSTASSRVGATAGKFRVDESGNVSYSIPLFTAPGSGGVTPQVSLNYNSQAGNGQLGVGWSLGGLSAITRCGQTLTHDGVAKAVSLTSDDRFCLDGQRLLLVPGTGNYGDHNAEYRTEIDAISRIISKNSAGSGPAYFTVERKDGSTSFYGNSEDSQIEADPTNQNSTVLIWAQNQFEDSAGNAIDFEYIEHTSGPVEFYIDEIWFAGGHAKFKFHYIDRSVDTNFEDDSTIQYVAGYPVQQTRLLKQIKSKGRKVPDTSNLSHLKFYELNYGVDGMGRNVVESIDECSDLNKTVCFDPTNFSWLKSEHGLSTSENNISVLPSKLRGIQVGDLSGDGRPDLIYIEEQGTSFKLKVRESTSSGGFGSVWANVFNLPKEKDGGPPQVQGIDFNADGYLDVLYPKYRSSTDDYIWVGRLSDGSDLSSELTLTGTPFEISHPDLFSQFRVLDFNGDGISDVLHNKTNSNGGNHDVQVFLNTFPNQGIVEFSDTPIEFSLDTKTLLPTLVAPSEWEATPNPTHIQISNRNPDDKSLVNPRVFDFNGDGRADLLVRVSRQYRKCQDNCPIPESSPLEGPSSQSGVVYTYQNASFWLVVYQNENDPISQEVVSRGADCLVSTVCYQQQYDSLPYSDYVWPVDMNADGLADLVYGDTASNWLVKLNTGIDFAAAFAISTVPNTVDSQVRIEDWNGDGFPDLLFPTALETSSATWKVVYNLFGSNYSAVVNTNVPAGHVGVTTDAEGDTSIFADFTGDGKRDYLFLNFLANGNLDSGNTKFRFGENLISGQTTNEPSNVITTITNGFGAATTISYEPLTNSSVYTRMNDSSAATWGTGVVYDLIAPIYVVRSVSSSAPTYNNASATASVSYHYVGAKMQAAGRGFLGFGEVVSYDSQSGIRTNTRYRQDFPYSGLPVETILALGGSSTAILSDPSQSAPPSWGGVSATTIAQTISGTRISYSINQWATKSTAGLAKHPYIAASLERSYSLSGAFDRKVLTTNSYDSYGNLTSASVKTYNTDTATDFATQSTTNTYDDDVNNWLLGRLATSSVTHSRSTGLNLTRNSSFEYDTTTGILDKEIIEPGHPEFEVITSYDLDAYGNRTSTTVDGADTSPRTYNTSFDTLGRFVDQQSNAIGQVVLKVNDWDAYGNPTDTQNIDGVTTLRAADHMGRPFASYSETGQFSKVTHSTSSNTNCPSSSAFHTTTSTGGAPTKLECFDVLGRVIRTGVRSLNGDYAFTDQYYDSSGRVERISQPYFSGNPVYWNINTYDAIGRLTSVDSADGNDLGNSFDHNASNSCGVATNPRVVKITNGLGQVQLEVKNALGEVIEVYDDECKVMLYDYDAVGNLTNLTKLTGVDGVETSMSYDLVGRKDSMSDPDKGFWEYDYNALGEMTRQLDSKDQAIDFSYDNLGRVTDRRELTDVSSLDDTTYSVVNREHTSYQSGGNGIGQVSSSTYYTGESGTVLHSKAFTYDGFGRLISVSTNAGGVLALEETTYDQYSRIFQQFDATGDDRGVRFVYTNGHISQIKEAADGVLGKVYQNILTTDAYGNVTAFQLGNGIEGFAIYEDFSGRLKNLNAYDSGEQLLQDVDYLFDVLGNLKHRHDKSNGLNGDDFKEVFDYDNLNRLESVDLSINGGSNNTTLSLTYNEAGNITWKSDLGNYLYNGAQPHAVTSAGSATYSYDSNGNQLTGDGRTLTYTVFDKPDSIKQGSGASEQRTKFAYGIGNSRYERKDLVGGVVQKTTVYLSSVEYIDDGTTTYYKRYIGGVAIGTYYPASGVQRIEYLLKDHLGSIHTVTNDSSLIVARMHFSAFGERYDVTDWQTALTSFQYVPLNDITTRGFTGHEHIDELNIIHMNGRIYDPRLGRMLQADPFIPEPTNSQSFDRYAYVFNNPLRYTDPSGFVPGDRVYVPITIREAWFNVFLARGAKVANSSNGPGYAPEVLIAQTPAGVSKNAIDQQAVIQNKDSFTQIGTTEAAVGTTATTITGWKFSSGALTDAFLGMFISEAIAQGPKSKITVSTTVDEATGEHEYVIRGVLCKSSILSCNNDFADKVFEHVNKNDIPFITNDLGTGERKLLPGWLAKILGTSRQPIDHFEDVQNRRSVNTALEPHEFYPGDVVHEVKFENGELVYEITGTGSGGNPEINNLAGVFIFRRDVNRAVDIFGTKTP